MILRSILGLLLFAIVAFFSFFMAHESRLSWFDAGPALRAAARYDATIVRDKFGVPHISGRRDVDAAFGLAYAHAEDNFPNVQRALLAARGRLASVDGVGAAASDYMVQLLGIWPDVEARYRTDISADTRALLDAYAAGLNLYAAQHRAEVLPGFAPARPEDMVALFMLRLPNAYGLDAQINALLAGNPVKIATTANAQSRGLAIAVSPTRSADGATRLLINPQGPFTGALSWYEAHVNSGEGWNVEGGLIPGSPVPLAGAGANFGWGFSFNQPDLIDIFALEGNPNDRYLYRVDREWRRLETREARIVVRFWGPIRWTFRREILRSVQGPVIRTAKGLYALRYAGMDDVRGVETFYRLNKARDLDNFMEVISTGGIPSLDFVFADRTGRIASIYNGAFPERADGFDWTRPVAGNVSAAIWNTYRPFDLVPKVIEPGSGFVVAAGATPFRTTAEPYNPKPDAFPAAMGIEQGMSNRARRALDLIGADKAITGDKFKAYKFDDCYDPNSDFAVAVKELGERNYAGDPLLEEAGEDLRRYNFCTDKDNRAAALAIMTVSPLLQARALGRPQPEPVGQLRNSANRLLRSFTRLDPAWGEVNRLRIGSRDLPIGGGPDTMADIELAPRLNSDGTSTARSGDALAIVSTWGRTGNWSVESVAPWGESANPVSPHYDDQAPLYADRQWKSVPVTGAALMAEGARAERPGHTTPQGQAVPIPAFAEPIMLAPARGLARNQARTIPAVDAVTPAQPVQENTQ